ncbi:C40 family peptidase [Nocardia uniformis]|uniref:C40 family peptidase n=1 Tax=Nocardia uniformis TaxID=53432 RepID=A0A849C374_9NOCA|nr:NlpC/P60 family protein [Nocardia uniformis]NNH72036.1 C40 family peptidase [Nocardia uniformis]
MSAVDIAALAQPITALRASLGAGSGGGEAAEVLRRLSDELDAIHSAGRVGIDQLYGVWQGVGGDAAMGQEMRGQTSLAELADRGRAMAEVVERATGIVASGQRELEEILRSFTSAVAALGPAALGPTGIGAVVAVAIDHLGRALAVVRRVRVELEEETAAMGELITPPPTPVPAGPVVVESDSSSTTPAGVGGVVGYDSGSGTALGTRMLDTGSQLAGGALTVPAALGSSTTTPASTRPTADDRTHPSSTGQGVKITLPDGSTVEAPNQQAADAVRNALSEVGTPYVWGGTTPGVGLDCSGLTQWAYAEAGVPLPRLAQQQGDGHMRVGPGEVLPGDLLVWDGHVAMVIGNGQLVEAGNPVQVGPIRTENSGMRFLGFYRPTA